MRWLLWTIKNIQGIVTILKESNQSLKTLSIIYSKRKTHPITAKYKVEHRGNDCVVATEVIITSYRDFNMMGHQKLIIPSKSVCKLYKARGFVAMGNDGDDLFDMIMPNNFYITGYHTRGAIC